MTNINYKSLLDRVVALQIEAMADISVTAQAFPNLYQAHNTYPYFVNRIGTIDIDGDSEDLDTEAVPVEMRLIIGPWTSGYKGEREEELYTWLPQIKRYFHERDLLTSDTYPTPLTGLWRGRISTMTGPVVFAGNDGSQRVGSQLTLLCDFTQYINEHYS